MQLYYKYAWIIPLLPAITAALVGLNLLVFRNATKSLRAICAILNISTLAIAMMLSFAIFWEQVTDNNSHTELWSWIHNQSVLFQIGYTIDPLSSIMLVVVTTVGVVVMIYTDGYMAHDKGYIRFFAYLSMFTASMLGLVLSPNLIQIYFFWELVGMCSYLLIGFWVTRPSAAAACQKAFITNRIGDFGLLLGILGFYTITNSFDFNIIAEKVSELLKSHSINETVILILSLLLFMGPIAKSAQFPLHVWLPDAMEGPTPISALIHAATMVAAGIFLVARLLPLFQNIPLMMDIIAYTGTITAFLGATLALSQRDLKRCLAYSTMSQLGYMMLAMGIGSYQAGIFHLLTHAYSKALLFLGAGSVIHGIESIVGYNPNQNQDMINMGGIRKYMPITGTTFLIGTLSLCGVPPFACFWSKDEILADSWIKFAVLGGFAWLTAGLTAFYMFRMYFLTFEGTFRGTKTFNNGENTRTTHKPILPHESTVSMVVPLVALCVPTIFIGLIGAPFAIEGSIIGILPKWLHIISEDSNSVHTDWIDFLLESLPSVGISFTGILLAWLIYGPDTIHTQNIKSSLDPMVEGKSGLLLKAVYNWSLYRGYIDDIYNKTFVIFTRNLSKTITLFDQWVVDGFVNSTGLFTLFVGESTRYGEVGRTNSYIWILMSGVTILLFIGLKI